MSHVILLSGLRLVNAFGDRTVEQEGRAWQSLTTARFGSKR